MGVRTLDMFVVLLLTLFSFYVWDSLEKIKRNQEKMMKELGMEKKVAKKQKKG